MPPIPSPGKVIRVRFAYTDGSDTNILNTVHFGYTGSVSSTDATDVGTSLGGAWGSDMKAYQTTNVTLETIQVTDLSSETGVEVTTNIGTAGTSSGTRLPSSACMVLKAAIAIRYRGGHPRVYLTGFAESFLLGTGGWSTTAQSDVLIAWNNILQSLTTSPPADLGVVSEVSVSYYQGFTSVQNPITKRYRNVPTLRTTPAVYTISEWSTNPKVASQRRRNQQSG